jgi:hypothetical protein
MFTRYKGKVKTVWLPATASTAFSKGAIVSWSSGYLIPATSSTTALSHAGVIERAVLSTDLDYATTGHLVPVSVPLEKNVVWKGDTTATLVVGDVGLEVDLTDSLTINRAASSIKVAMVHGVLSTTLGLFLLKLNGAY